MHNCYGDELGLTSDDEDYIDPYDNRDDETLQTKVTDSVSEVRFVIDRKTVSENHSYNFLGPFRAAFGQCCFINCRSTYRNR